MAKRAHGATHVAGLLLSAFLMAAVGACDRPKPPATTATAVAVLPPRYSVDVASIASLHPGKRTHVTVDGMDHVYWVQEMPDNEDVVFVTGPSDVAKATELGTHSILEALGEGGGEGNIQSIATGPDNLVFFYFSGGHGRKLLSVIGYYSARGGEIHVVADTDAILKASELGDTLDLARGSLIAGGRTGAPCVWLWLRQNDQGVLLHFDPLAAANGSADLGRLPTVQAHDKDFPLTSDLEDLSAGPKESLLYLDRAHAALWRIDAIGEATVSASMVGVPDSATAPVSDGQGRMLILAGDTVLMGATEVSGARPMVLTRFPALLIIDGEQVAAVPADKFNLPMSSDIQLQALSPALLVPLHHPGACITYDRASGELLRLTLTAK